MRDLSNHIAPYILFDGDALAIKERSPKGAYEKLMARVAKRRYYEPNVSFMRTLHTLSYKGEYNIGILYDPEGENAEGVWDALTDEEGHPIFRILDGKPHDVDFIAYPIRHFFSDDPSRSVQSRVGMSYSLVWSVLS